MAIPPADRKSWLEQASPGIDVQAAGPLLQALRDFAHREAVRLHMPGHHGQAVTAHSQEIQRSLYAYDTTELPGLDNLMDPTGVLASSQSQAAKLLGAGQCLYLTGGASAGLLSMITALIAPGQKVLVPRQAHRCVYHALQLADAKPIWLWPDLTQALAQGQVLAPIGLPQVREAISLHPDAVALVLTRPTYEGLCSDLPEIVAYCHSQGLRVLVDEAHGAHLTFEPTLPPSAMESGADASVCSVHKMLPALGQTALLLSSKKLPEDLQRRLRRQMGRFQSTSPSYVLLASIEEALWHIKSVAGQSQLQEAVAQARRAAKDLGELPGVHSFADALPPGLWADPLHVGFWTDLPGGTVQSDLRARGMEVEMSQGNFVLALLGAAHTQEATALVKAVQALVQAPLGTLAQASSIDLSPLLGLRPQSVCSSAVAEQRCATPVPLAQAAGRVSAASVALYPPGIPLLIAGERVPADLPAWLSHLQEDPSFAQQVLIDGCAGAKDLPVLEEEGFQ